LFVGQDEDDPQTWNLYAYTSNNPLNRVDPDGQRWFYRWNENGDFEYRWVNPNADGTYTPPQGGGWIELAPDRHLEIYVDKGRQFIRIGEHDGNPCHERLATGKIETNLETFITGELALVAVGRGAIGLWGAFKLKKLSSLEKAKDAYETAREGGKHAGFLRNYANKSAAEIRRGITSIEKEIAKHRDKIANPENHIKDWNKLDPRQKEALVNKKWPSDIQRQTEQAQILKELLKTKQ